MYNLFFLLSIDNSVISSLYLFLLFIFLIPIFFLINFQLLKLIYNIISLKKILFLKDNQNIQILNNNHILTAAKIYIFRKKWFECILLLESVIEFDIDNSYYYNFIGFCYYNMDLNHLAKKYYLKALDFSPSCLIVLSNLAKVYHLLGEDDNAINLYNKILMLDKNNKIAKNYLNL